MTQVYIGGHRGLGGTDSDFAQKRNAQNDVDPPSENTIESLMKGLRMGARFVETDLIATADNEIALTHSNDPRQHIRIPGFEPEKKFIADMTLAEVQSLPIGENGTDQIPSLRELLRAVKLALPMGDLNSKDFYLNLELKGVQGTDSPSNGPSLAALALKIIHEENFPLERIRFSSFSLDMLEDMARHEPKARLGMLYDRPKEEGGFAGDLMFADTKEGYVAFNVDTIKETLRRIPQLEAVHPEVRSLTPETAAFAAANGLAIATWGWLENSPLKDAEWGGAAQKAVALARQADVGEISLITDHIADTWQYLAQRAQPKATPQPKVA